MSLLGRLRADPRRVQTRTLANLSAVKSHLSKSAIDGGCLMASAIMDELFREKVITAKEHEELLVDLRAWQRAHTSG